LASAAGTSYAAGSSTAGAFKKPWDPLSGSVDVAKSTLLTLSFSETVQAGTGSVCFGDFSVAVATANCGGGLISTLDTYFSGSTVYVSIPYGQKGNGGALCTDATCGLTPATTHTIKTSVAGTFQNKGGDALQIVTQGKTLASSWKTVSDDSTPPILLMSTPKHDTVDADDAPGTMITLYFSEAVQTMKAKKVTLNDGATTTAIPLDNSLPDKGTVAIVGAVVQIDPFDDLKYDKTVTFNIEANAFTDLASDGRVDSYNSIVDATLGNAFTAQEIKFKTPSFSFTLQKNNNETVLPFSQREGMIAHSLMKTDGSEVLMVYGGQKDGKCLDDGYMSADMGKTWSALTSTVVNGSSASLGVRAYAKTAVDENGCVWLYHSKTGEMCSGPQGLVKMMMPCEPTADSSIKWVGVSPTASAGAEFGNFDGAGIAIVGGWQLVVVDSVGGTVWQASDKSADVMERVRESVPFSLRRDPMLLTTSAGDLFLTGGYDKDACEATDAYCKSVFTDVWKSADSGRTWTCVTANYDPSLTTEYGNGEIKSLGLGRRVAAAISYDDTIFMIAGAKPNETSSLNTVWTSYSAAADAVAPVLYDNLMSPTESQTSVMTNAEVSLYFNENIFYSLPSTTLANSDIRLTSNLPVAGTVLSTTTEISRQRLKISLKSGVFTKAAVITITVPQLALKDEAGNALGAAISKQFTITDDVTAPVVSGFKVATNWVETTGTASTGIAPTDVAKTPMGVSPYTNILLEFNEKVTKNSAATPILVKSTLGNTISLDINADTTEILQHVSGGTSMTKIFFQLPDGPKNETTFTENTLFTIDIPAKLVFDVAGNPNVKDVAKKFTTNSGSYTARNYEDKWETVQETEFKDDKGLLVNDTAKPVLASSWPPEGATDVLVGDLVSLYLFFDEPVQWNVSRPSAIIEIKNSTSHVTKTLNVTKELVSSVDGTKPNMAHVVEPLGCRINETSKVMIGCAAGVKITVGTGLTEVTKKGQQYTVTIPAGALEDKMGNKNAEIVSKFTTLAGTPITTPPAVLFATPYDGQAGVLSSSFDVNVWFSEKIKKGEGAVTLQKVSDTTNPKVMPLGSTNLTIEGSKLSMSFYPGVFDKKSNGLNAVDQGSWNLVLPSGLVFDATNDQKFTGLNDTSGAATHSFAVVLADTTKPTFVPANQKPFETCTSDANAMSKTCLHDLPISTSLQMVADEAVMTGVGKVKFVPKYSSPEVHVEAAMTVVQGAYVFVDPGDLMPGEVYSVQVDAGAFADAQKNANVALTTGWTVSTMPLIKFLKVTTGANSGYFDSLTEPTGNVWFSGERYGASAVFDKKNNLYVMAGHNGTAAANPPALNDVWVLATRREVNCGSSKLPVFECTTDGLEPSLPGVLPDNAVEMCDADGNAGKSNYETTIWQAPSSAGAKCVTSTGEFASVRGEILSKGADTCDCPMCKSLPEFAALMNANVSASILTEMLPVTAKDGTVPLTCNPGFRASTNFTCGFGSLAAGAWKNDSMCERAPCTGAPEVLASMNLNPLVGCNETSAGEWRSGKMCPYECMPGYGVLIDGKAKPRMPGMAKDGEYTCTYDESSESTSWIASTNGCEKLSCEVDGVLACSATENGAMEETAMPTIGMICSITCPGGEKKIQQRCTESATDPRGQPMMLPFGTDATGCPEITVAPTMAPTTMAPTTTLVAETTKSVQVTEMPAGGATTGAFTEVEEVFVETSMTSSVDPTLPENFEKEALFQQSTDEALCAGVKLTAGNDFPCANVKSTSLEVTGSERRLSENPRRLARSLEIKYSIKLTETMVAAGGAAGFTDDFKKNTAAFQNAFADQLVESVQTNQGRTIARPTVVQSTVFETKTVKVKVPVTNAPAVTEMPAGGVTVAPSKTPSSSPDEEEEEADNTAMIVGIVIGCVCGLGLVGVLFYFYQKKKGAE